jgi:hypothetical protein
MDVQMITPYVGMPVTYGIGAGKYAGDVVNRLSPTKIVIRYRTLGRYEIWTLRKNGQWKPKGAKQWSGVYLVLGKDTEYRDPEF